MDELIALITKNPIIIIVLLGFLFSLFSRKNKTGNAPNRRPNPGVSGGQRPGHPVDPGSQAPPIPEWVAAEAERAKERARASASETPIPPFIRETYTQTKEKRERRQNGAMRASGGKAAKPAGPRDISDAYVDRGESLAETLAASHPPEAAPTPKRKKSDLAQAVMWAEILGPPRSRKPHGRNFR